MSNWNRDDEQKDLFSENSKHLEDLLNEDYMESPDPDGDMKTYSPSHAKRDPKVTTSSSNGKTFEKRKISKKAYIPPKKKPLVDNAMELPEQKKRSTGRALAGKIGKTVLSLFLIFVITGCIVAGAFVVYVFTCVDDTIEFDLNNLKLNDASVIYVQDPDYEGTPEPGASEGWIEYQSLSNEKRIWVNINDVSMNLVNAYVSGEDERFYEHKGVDWKRTFGAFVNLFIEIYDTQQGGSTITQQLVKNLTGDDEKDEMRKIREIMRARKLEQMYSKDTILECYLNVIYLGHGCYGVEAAADYYFGKTSAELSIAEAAAIAATTKAPSYYDPIDNPENNRDRRNWIIKNECKLGKITEEERDAALEEELVLVGSSSTSTTQTNTGVYSYYTDAVIEQVIDDLMEEYGYAESYASNILENGGLQIYAACDVEIQKIMEEEYLDEDNFAVIYDVKEKAQSAMSIMDYSGHIVALVGGRGEKTESRGLNRATQSPRQPGSTMKPLGVYAPAIENNVTTYSRRISNSALSIGSFSFKNYDGTTSAPVTVQNALERSLNLPPIRILQDLGFNNSYTFCTEKIGLSHLTEEDKNANLAVGGLQYGYTSVEASAAYAIFGNGGQYYEPTTYYQVLDSKGEVLLSSYENEPIEAISEETATIMNRLLRTTVTGYNGTAGRAAFDGFQVFAKTGTTSDNKDRWFCGGTPYYVGSVWFGCDQPVAMNSLSTSTNPALVVWKAVMTRVHEGLDNDKTFEMSDDVIARTYCEVSGKVAGDKCPKGGTGYYKSDYAPTCNGKSDHIIKDVSSEDASSMESSSEESSSEESGVSGQSSSKPKTSKPSSSKPSASSKPAASSKPGSKPASSATSTSSTVTTPSSAPVSSEEPVSSAEPEPVSSEASQPVTSTADSQPSETSPEVG